jgi:CRISPR-associated endonuclease/helicase Cas3
VCSAADAVFDAVGPSLAEGLAISFESLAAEIRPLLKAAALLHDLAKINSSFQAMLRSRPGDSIRQPVRHEIMGAWLLCDNDFLGRWFSALRSEAEIWPIIWAVAGHHLKMGDPARGAPLFNTGSGTREVILPLTTGQVSRLLLGVAASLGSTRPVPETKEARFDTVDDDASSLEQRIADFAESSCLAWNRLRRNQQVVRRTALLKALLFAADVAASALTANGEKPAEWVPRALGVRITTNDLEPIIATGTKGKDPLPFQTNVELSNKLATIVIAGCGNGKTTAAYLWAKRWAAGRKLWFTYPTTGTASAGYQGYLYDHPDLLSTLMHGRAEVDLQAMRGNKEDDDDEPLRLESLRAWDRQAIVCTVDTVLGLLQNQRRPLFSFPVIASGAFVFDEIHSYDVRLFGGLLRFLKTFPGMPVLLMSASIPPARMTELKKILGERAGEVIRGDPEMEGYQRYSVHSQESPEACQTEVKAKLQAEKKVLWVCNTVKDAIKIAQNARQWAETDPIIYHSRFRYRDRVKRQNDLIAAFRAKGRLMAVTTQVCEMSLDISADLMVTAECPLPALVQRLGRLNRYAGSDDPWPCLVYPFIGDPYNEKPEFIRNQTRGDFRVSMSATRALVKEMAGLPCRQKDLAARLDNMVENEQFKTDSAWLDDGWITEPAAVRDGDESVTLIREEDLAEIKLELGPESKWTAATLVPWTIPMRYRKTFKPTDRKCGYPIAPIGTVNYCEKEGASWQSTTN